MPDNNLVVNHYTHGSLIEAIKSGISKLGKSVSTVSINDLAPIDEFHIGGQSATIHFLNQLEIKPGHKVLDVGCGLGGSSRFSADKYNCQVTGVDLTEEYVETGNTLCGWLSMNQRIQLEVADATSLPYESETFDRAFMLHVGMNISEKAKLASELLRVLKPGGRVGIYDVMEMGHGKLKFPVPWATSSEGSSVESPHIYKAALKQAGFKIITENSRREFALEFFQELQSKAAASEGPPPLGLHILMGESAPTKVKNMIDNISNGLVSPTEIIAVK